MVLPPVPVAPCVRETWPLAGFAAVVFKEEALIAFTKAVAKAAGVEVLATAVLVPAAPLSVLSASKTTEVEDASSNVIVVASSTFTLKVQVAVAFSLE